MYVRGPRLSSLPVSDDDTAAAADFAAAAAPLLPVPLRRCKRWHKDHVDDSFSLQQPFGIFLNCFRKKFLNHVPTSTCSGYVGR